MLLGELNYLETFGYLEVQAVKLVYPAEERLLLGLDGDDNTVFCEQFLEIVRRYRLAGDGALAKALKHGVGNRETDVGFVACLWVIHISS